MEYGTTFSKYQYETSSLNFRLSEMKRQEEELTTQKEEYVKQKKVLEDEYQKVKRASQEVQRRSEQVEEFARVSLHFKPFTIKRPITTFCVRSMLVIKEMLMFYAKSSKNQSSLPFFVGSNTTSRGRRESTGGRSPSTI